MSAATTLRGGRFLVVGRAGMDFYADPPGTRVESAGTFTAAMGGSAGNTAAGLCRQGAQAALVTVVSDDAVADFVIAELDRYGVDRAYVRRVGGEARTSLAVVATRLDDTQSVIYRNGAADFDLQADDVAAVDMGRFDAVVTSGTVLAAEPSRSAGFAAFEAARAAGLPVIFDVDYRPYSWTSAEEAAEVYSRAAERCDIIVGNDVEFGFMAGDYDRGLEKARDLAAHGAFVVYKMGEKGAITLAGGQETRTGIYEVEALKSTGAGDGFMAGFLAALSKGHSPDDAVRRGSATAAIVVSKVGCAPAMPTPAELDAFLSSHPGPSLP